MVGDIYHHLSREPGSSPFASAETRILSELLQPADPLKGGGEMMKEVRILFFQGNEARNWERYMETLGNYMEKTNSMYL